MLKHSVSVRRRRCSWCGAGESYSGEWRRCGLSGSASVDARGQLAQVSLAVSGCLLRVNRRYFGFDRSFKLGSAVSTARRSGRIDYYSCHEPDQIRSSPSHPGPCDVRSHLWRERCMQIPSSNLSADLRCQHHRHIPSCSRSSQRDASRKRDRKHGPDCQHERPRQ